MPDAVSRLPSGCVVCGQPRANMRPREWGHHHACCSEECGRETAKAIRLAREMGAWKRGAEMVEQGTQMMQRVEAHALKTLRRTKGAEEPE